MTQAELTVGMAQWLPGRQPAGDALEEALAMVAALAAEGAELVVLPELWPCAHDPSYPEQVAAEVRARAEPLEGPRGRALAGAAAEHGVWLAAGSVPERAGDQVFNALPLYSPAGDLHAVHRKAHLYEPMNEQHSFAAGDRLTVCDMGEIGTVGLAICFDGDFPETARKLRRAGARLVIHVDAYETGAESWWDRIYPTQALVNGQWWVMVNQCGTRGSTTFLGKSRIISPQGEIVLEAPRAGHGETPPAATLVHTIPLAAGLERADAESGALFGQARPELEVENGAAEAQTTFS